MTLRSRIRNWLGNPKRNPNALSSGFILFFFVAIARFPYVVMSISEWLYLWFLEVPKKQRRELISDFIITGRYAVEDEEEDLIDLETLESIKVI